MITVPETLPRELDSARAQLLARVAWMYYEEELTQAEIGERLGISRVTANRLLKEARETGVVEIKIHSSLASGLALSSQVRQRFGLTDVYTIQSPASEEEMRLALARAAAQVLEQRLQPGLTIGIGIGRTISYLPDFLHPSQPVACRFTSLTGGLRVEATPSSHNFDVLNRLAAGVGGLIHYIPAPSCVADESIRSALLEDPSVRESLEVARSSSVAVFSAGEADTSALLYQSGLLTDRDLAELHGQQAAGDVLGRFFNSGGKELAVRINRRMIGVSIAELKAVPFKILVAGGDAKHRAIRALLENHLADVLITDPETAIWLISTPEPLAR